MTDDNNSTRRSGNRTLYEQKVVSFTHLHHPQILCRDATVTHMTGHSHVLEDSAWEQTLTDRATAAMPALRTVRHVATGKLMTSHDPLKSFRSEERRVGKE